MRKWNCNLNDKEGRRLSLGTAGQLFLMPATCAFPVVGRTLDDMRSLVPLLLTNNFKSLFSYLKIFREN